MDDLVKLRPHLFLQCAVCILCFCEQNNICRSVPVLMTLCSLTFSLKQLCCCGRNRMHFHYRGCLPWTLLTTSFYCVSQEVVWPLHCRSSMADFQFSCVCVCSYFATDRCKLANTFRKLEGDRHINDMTLEQGSKNVTADTVNNNCGYLLCAISAALPNIVLSKR